MDACEKNNGRTIHKVKRGNERRCKKKESFAKQISGEVKQINDKMNILEKKTGLRKSWKENWIIYLY